MAGKPYTFLTAIRNEEKTIESFLIEFHQVLANQALLGESLLIIVDDYSLDSSAEIIKNWHAQNEGLDVKILTLATNLGNQGALGYALGRCDFTDSQLLITLDSDGEDDLEKIPEMIELWKSDPNNVIFSERGRRYDSSVVPFLYYMFRCVMIWMMGQKILPNNFMALPAKYIDAVKRSPFVPVYYGLAVMRLRFPYISKVYDRRIRYGGKSSQNIFNLITHGFVGLLVFHETVIARIFSLLLMSIGFFSFTSLFALFVKFVKEKALPGWTALFFTVNFGFILFIMAMLAIMASCAMFFKLSGYHLSEMDDDVPGPKKL
ncbi:MAG: glycosyltransferase [Planctomycetes bacterium]|nr:glycosyltransferase [Planctomycetota bacterium]